MAVSISYLLSRLDDIENAEVFAWMQASYRLSELTNTFKTAFVPSKDNKRIMYNMISGGAIMGILYSLSFVFLKVPPALVKSPHPLL